MRSELIIRAKEEISMERDNLYIAVICSLVFSVLVIAYLI